MVVVALIAGGAVAQDRLGQLEEKHRAAVALIKEQGEKQQDAREQTGRLDEQVVRMQEDVKEIRSDVKTILERLPQRR